VVIGPYEAGRQVDIAETGEHHEYGEADRPHTSLGWRCWLWRCRGEGGLIHALPLSVLPRRRYGKDPGYSLGLTGIGRGSKRSGEETADRFPHRGLARVGQRRDDGSACIRLHWPSLHDLYLPVLHIELFNSEVLLRSSHL